MEDDVSLPSRVARGDRAAFAALMDDTKTDLHRFVRRYVGEDDDAYDLVQETYVAAWLAIRRYDPSRPFPIWLRAIAINKCRDWGRKRAVRRAVRGVMGLDAPEALTVGDGAPAGEVQLDDRLRMAALDRALANLPDTLKTPLLLTTLEGRSHAEVARLIGATPKAVETRIARARRALTAALGRTPWPP